MATFNGCGVEESISLENAKGVLVSQGKYYILDQEFRVASKEVAGVTEQLACWKRDGIDTILIKVCGSKNIGKASEFENLAKTTGFQHISLERTDCSIATEEA